MKQSFKKQFIGLLLITAILFGNLSAFAQKRGGGGAAKPNAPGGQTQAANQKNEKKKECKGNYSGVVTYKREIKQHRTGKYGTTYDRNYIYRSTIPIRDDGSTQGAIYPSAGGIEGSFNFYGLAEATKDETVNDLQASEKDDYCKLSIAGMNGKTRVHCETLVTTKDEALGKGNVSVFLSFKGDKYSISLDNPKVNGTVSITSKQKCTGTCTKDEGQNYQRQSSYKNDARQGTYTDDQRLDPNNINRLAGTFTRIDGEETETITWNLARCAPPLSISDLAFEVHKYPDPNAWHGIDPLQGTIDGNLVKVKATVFNANGETSYATVKFTDTTTGDMLPNGSVSVSLKAGETRDVEYEWDTSGFAWDDVMRPTLARKIKAEVDGDSVEKKILIIPKPVVAVHGLWSNAAAWAAYHQYLRDAYGNFAWQVFPVGEDPAHGLMNTGKKPGNLEPTNTIYQNSKELEKQIEFVQQSKNAWHVDLVAHSMGGLISRQYIHSFMKMQFDRRPTVTHLVMLGTPNQGSPCADTADNTLTEHGNPNMHALRELRPYSVRAFNTRITDRKNVRFSILAGTPIPFTCLTTIRGDGVVPLQSALWTIADRRFAPRNHVDLTGIEDFKYFVWPRLAVGPKKAQEEIYTAQIEAEQSSFAALLNRSEMNNRSGFDDVFQKVSYKNSETALPDESAPEDSDKNITARLKVELAANQTKEIDIPVKNGNYAAVMLFGSPGVSATLIDAGGAIVGKNESNIDSAREPFRTIAVQKQIADGVWKLRLENHAAESSTMFVTAAAGRAELSDFTVEAGKPSAPGQVPLTARWTRNGAPVLNVRITANILGEKNPVEFFDDGRHRDGAPNDGLYGALTEKLPNGDYALEATAEADNKNATAVVTFTVGGAAASPIKPPAAVKKPTPRRNK